MTKISSDFAYRIKQFFPILWFASLIIISITLLITGNYFALLCPIFLSIFGYLLMSYLLFCLVDAVYMEEDALLIQNKDKEIQVKFADITHLEYQNTNPPKLTISVAYKTELGQHISFSPIQNVFRFSKPVIVKELEERVKQAKATKNKNCIP